ncbi:hypothetical protein [Sinosporangium siamense]|uniref:Uncharacterized protein n=1 Tax=Sinosporangium siamense TaxID=1367973 RepID=A0A919RFG6_9ACTN|nr:hypothetical protein [Sinosporangium siamense]GII90804.1 hypothetical protein Ssi02_10350 [Sinosporangium siamense]
MGFPGEPPRRQPYVNPEAGQWFDAPPQNRPDGPGDKRPDPMAAEPPRIGRPLDSSSAGPPPPRPGMWSPYDEGPRSRRPLFLAVGGIVLLVAGGVGLAMLSNSTPAPVAAPSPTPVPSLPESSKRPEGEYGYAASRATDPAPLTIKELFRTTKVTRANRSYTMTVRRLDKKCKNGVTGPKITKAIADGKCTQIIRASFRDRTGKIIGTIGVANLRNSAAVAKVATAGGGGERKDYVKPLPGKDKVTKSLGSGEAYAGVWRHGHYAVMLWFQYKDGHLPSKKERTSLNQAAVDIAELTVFRALDSRTLTGKAPR